MSENDRKKLVVCKGGMWLEWHIRGKGKGKGGMWLEWHIRKCKAKALCAGRVGKCVCSNGIKGRELFH